MRVDFVACYKHESPDLAVRFFKRCASFSLITCHRSVQLSWGTIVVYRDAAPSRDSHRSFRLGLVSEAFESFIRIRRIDCGTSSKLSARTSPGNIEDIFLKNRLSLSRRSEGFASPGGVRNGRAA